MCILNAVIYKETVNKAWFMKIHCLNSWIMNCLVKYKYLKEITKDIKTTVENLLDIAGNLSQIIHNASPIKQNKLLKLLIKDCTLQDKELKYAVRASFDKFIQCDSPTNGLKILLLT